MKVSIVTISYNQDRFLEDSIRSVLEQDYHDLEYIVVDPGSDDRSREIISHYGDRIDEVVFEPDDGPAQGLNHGFARANGQIYGFLNADDFLLPGAVSAMVASFKRLNEADVVAANGWIVDEHARPIRKKHSHRFSAWRYLHRAAHLLQQSTFFRAEAFHKVGGFNEDNRTCWDGELWLDMALSGCRFQTLNKNLSCFRAYPNSISGQIADQAHARRSYEWDRNRMFRRATGRDPNGVHYRLSWGAAQLLKWSTNLSAFHTSLHALAKVKLGRSPVEV